MSHKHQKSKSRRKYDAMAANLGPIKESDYINTIISKNIIGDISIPTIDFNKLKYNINNLMRKMLYICSSKSNYKQLKKDNYLFEFLNLSLFLLEYKTNIKQQKEELLKSYILLLNKVFINNKISIRDISLLIKFLIYSSVYDRKDININNINLLEKLTGNRIKSYETIKFVIDIIKTLNIPMVSIEFCEFLNAHFLMNKYNTFLLTKKTDLLDLIFLKDQNDYILDCLSKIYSFRSNRTFIELFFEKIKDVYKEIRDKNINKKNESEMNTYLLKILNNINRSILFITSIKQNEENKFKEDSYFPTHGFFFSNSKNNGLFLEKIIIRNNLTIVFSFNFIPSDKKDTSKNDKEYPIIYANSNKDPKDSMYFYIKNDVFYYKQFKSNKLYPICNIKKNQTYLCYYSIKEHENFIIAIKSDDFEYEITDIYKDFLKKNITIRIGRYNKQNFEGYMGSILLFKEYFDEEYKNYFFSLKGHYDRILYFYNYNTSESDKFDGYYNSIINDGNVANCFGVGEENKKDYENKKVKKEGENNCQNNNNNIKMNNRDYFLHMRKRLKENDIINSNLMCYVSPLFSNSALKKKIFTNHIFVETSIKKLDTDTEGTVIFYKNRSFIFQFLKYDGFYYIIMVLEIIMANYDYIKIKSHEKAITDIFQCIIIFITGLLSYINIESYYNEIRKLIFCIKKFFLKFNNYKAIKEGIHLILNNNFQNFDELIKKNFTENKKHCINAIKNEICKILLNDELYDLNNFALINKFMINMSNFVENQNNTTGLLNMKLFNIITNFANIYEKINIKNNNIKHDSQFKLFKKYYSKIVTNYVKRSESLEIYNQLYNTFSKDLNFNYLKYQSIKLFYLVSENFFNTVDEAALFKSWKYFVDLFDFLEKYGFRPNIEGGINEKEQFIIMSICLSIILENLKYKEFFKFKLKNYEEENDPYENLLLKTKEEDIKKNINSSMIYKLISSGYWKESNNYVSADKKKGIKRHKRAKSFSDKKDMQNSEFIVTENKKRINSFWNPKQLHKNNIFKSTSNLLLNKQSTRSIMYENENKIINQKSKYSDYCSYLNLYSKLSKSTKLNDYCFKAMLLYVLELNNKVNVCENVKLNFILKVKKYEQLDNPDYKSFLCIKYYNQEIKTEFKIFLKILENNKNRLSNICYDLLLYLLIQMIKDREHTRNICTVFLENRKICDELFELAFLNNKESASLFIKEFPLFIKLALPYHRKNFIPFLLYDSILDPNIHKNYAEQLFNIILTTQSDFNNTNKYYYDLIINKVYILYNLFKNEKISLDDKINLDDIGLLSLFDENLLYVKYDILYGNRKKSYIEMLYELFLNLYIKSKNKKYSLIMDKIFLEEVQKIQKKVNGSNTIIFYIDKDTIKDDKKNLCLKYYNNKNAKIENALCIVLLITTLKYWYKYINQTNEIKDFLQKYINYLFEDSILIYKENKNYQKKEKYKEWYNFILENINEIVKNKKDIKITDIQQLLVKQYNTELNTTNKDDSHKMSFMSDSNNLSLINNSELDFTKDNNESTSDIEVERDEETAPLIDLNAIINSNTNVNLSSIRNTVRTSLKNVIRNSLTKKKDDKNNNNAQYNNYNQTISPSEKLIGIRNEVLGNRYAYNYIMKDISKDYNYDYIDEYLDIENIDKRSKVVLFPKNFLLEQRFSLYFTDILFYNKLFVLLKHYFKYYIKQKAKKEIDINNYFNYPTIIRNYTPQNTYFGEFFVKNDLNFFYNKLIKVSHKYFLDILEKFNNKDIRIFPKKVEQEELFNSLVERQTNDNVIFYVDLISSRTVIFGQLIVSKYMIYFENLDKAEFLKNKTDSAKEKWLLCSLDCDYDVNKVKRIYIFKSEISEIINRRFLYLFQACEIFLKNGKSYYFNFYTEQKKIQFMSIFNKNSKERKESKDNKDKENKENGISYDIDIINDLKLTFKKRKYTKQWLTNELSTLEYLLLLNKFSSRSYNDINQYPVFPWLEIYGGKIRDLKYTTAAQTEDERLTKKEMYLASSDKFPYHYTTHYSNSAYLAYYLVRTNPFTNNQINLQGNKFDSPMRQFNAIDEILKILNHTSQPREVIPEFFLNTEFYYNYNCNFYGLTDDGQLINNLYNKEGYKSPLEYVLHNAMLLEAAKTKNEINYFFDNIYGVGQMSGVDGYNTYDKYSYQEMIDLRGKIEKFIEKKYTYNVIKKKIFTKCNKIISFGQTPFKLLEDKHPQWIIKKQNIESTTNANPNLNNNNNLNDKNTTVTRISIFNFLEDEDKNTFGINLSTNILYYDIISNFNKDNSKQCIFMLNKLSKYKYELRFYDTKFKEFSSVKSIIIPKEIKLYSKLKIFKNNYLNLYKYNPKYIMINFKLSLFIFCHFNDNSFKIFSKNGDNYSIMTESMITCITKINENSFLTGHNNGKIIGWELHSQNNEKEKEITIKDFSKINIMYNFMAHKNRVNIITYSKKLGVIISSGDDKKILIRKFIDLSLLTCIDISNKICIDIKVEHYFLYALLFDENKQKHIIEVYSLNGILVGKSDYDYINNINFDKDGNVLVGYYKKSYIDIFDPSLCTKFGEINLLISDAKLLNNDKKSNYKISNENITIGDEILLMNFCYNKYNNSIYCLLSNKFLYCKSLN